ncbi:Wadjet anti-phage system protein JetD domain-containing protein [Arthrobacter sp. NPDC092385]|uniref:Wadjet anti-phage system protein JetD domain-containing protein n=1 Tax=Arthrobacter sp. NPDC092385 TaxID=3363943 RepID=UPI0038057B2F
MPADASARWTTLANLRTLSATAWQRGSLLREVLEPSGAYPRRRALKKPTAAELRDHYAAARSWSGELTAAAGAFSLELIEVGRTTIGANQVPAAAVFANVDDEIAFVGKDRDTARAVALTAELTEVDPALRAWVIARPMQLLELGEDAVTASRVALWLREHRSPAIYVRQLSLPGVHTKFVEGHRRTITEMLSVLRPEDPMPAVELAPSVRVDEVPSSVVVAQDSPPGARFAARHGFLHAPERVRFRVLDPELSVLGSARDLTVTADAFASLRLPVDEVIVTENLVNFLSLPDRPMTLALFGGGYGFSSLRDAGWLRSCAVHYWGDLDTHGFRILDQLRAVHPQVGSMLMDEETLLAHRDRWGTEPTPSRVDLTRLTAAEAEMYRALQQDVYGPSVRLEQELIRWNWAEGALLHLPSRTA